MIQCPQQRRKERWGLILVMGHFFFGSSMIITGQPCSQGRDKVSGDPLRFGFHYYGGQVAIFIVVC